MTGPVINQTAFNTGTDPSGNTNASDSYIPNLPLSNSTSPAAPGMIPTSGVCGMPAGGSATPPRCGYGPRLPYLVISPWSKVNYVSHETIDQSSTIALVEFNWSLPFIDGATAPAPGTASYDRIAGSIRNMFDFDDQPNNRPLILDDQTGLVVSGGNGNGNAQD